MGKINDNRIGAINTDTDKIIKLTNNKLSAEGERTIFMKRKYTVAAAAAAVCILTVTSVFASSAMRTKLGDIISYFKNEKAVELSGSERLEKLSYAVGISDEKNGYKLTLDNIAADDNYLNVFYTLYSEKGGYTDSMHEPDVYVTCLIDGKPAELAANNNKSSFYAADEHTVKFAQKYNLSCIDSDNTFTLELFGEQMELMEITGKLYDGKNFSERDKNENLYLKTTVNKSDNYVKKFNMPLWNSGMELKKFIYSPFGSQLVIKLKNIDSMTYFAVFDDDKNSLDVINPDLRLDADGTNSLELLKVAPDTENLHLVPFASDMEKNNQYIRKSAETFPVEFEASAYGKIIITGIDYKDGTVEVHYKKDGFTVFDPSFDFYDENGEIIPIGRYEVRVNYDTDSYTMYCFGKVIPGQIKSIECLKSDLKLDFSKEKVIKIR